MKQIFLVALATISAFAPAQLPVVSTYAYSRHTIPGIPEASRAEGPSKTALPISYFIYVVVKKGTPLSVRRAWVKGRCYSATLQRVASPVLIEHDAAVPTGRTDTLVPKTSDDVYRVVLAAEETCKGDGEAASELRRHNEVVVSLDAGQSRRYGTARTVKALQPAAAM